MIDESNDDLPPTDLVREYLDLPEGRKLPLPFHWEPGEFGLPGNSEIHAGGALIAVYDPISRSGAVWYAVPRPFWHIVQPFLRDDFFNRYVRECVDRLKAEGLVPEDA